MKFISVKENHFCDRGCDLMGKRRQWHVFWKARSKSIIIPRQLRGLICFLELESRVACERCATGPTTPLSSATHTHTQTCPLKILCFTTASGVASHTNYWLFFLFLITLLSSGGKTYYTLILQSPCLFLPNWNGMPRWKMRSFTFHVEGNQKFEIVAAMNLIKDSCNCKSTFKH